MADKTAERRVFEAGERMAQVSRPAPNKSKRRESREPCCWGLFGRGSRRWRELGDRVSANDAGTTTEGGRPTTSGEMGRWSAVRSKSL